MPGPTLEIQLVRPCERYRKSFIEAVKEFQADTDSLNTGSMGRYRDVRIEDLERDFASFLRGLEDASGRNVKPGLVPETTYWLVETDSFIGRVSIRHRLNEKLMRVGGHIGYEIRPSSRRRGYGTLALRLGLEKARELGMARVLVTCDRTNVPSRKIIEANGGVMENEVMGEDGKPPKQRFWIEIA